MEKGRISDSAILDFRIGDTNDVEITCEKGLLDFGMYLICPGTEYGALIEETRHWDKSGNKKSGSVILFLTFLQEFIIEPPAGQDYRIVKRDAH